MLKFLRKYNKWILVIGGSLLMVAFLAPGAIQRCGFNPARQTVAKLDGEKISALDYDLARRQYAALAEIFPVAIALVDQDRKQDHWLLLAHAARQGGFVGETEDGYDWGTGELAAVQAQRAVLAQWRQRWGNAIQFVLNQPQFIQQFQGEVAQATQQFAAAFEQQHDSLAARSRLTPDQLDEALATSRGILRMLDAYTTAARMSDRRAIEYSDRQRDEAYVDAVFVPAEAMIDQIGEPTEERLAEHYERFIDTRPGEGEYGIGYLLPQRVKLAYLTLNRAAIRDSFELNPIEVRKRYEQNRAEYPGEFDQARPRVERAMRDEIADLVMQEAHQAVRTIVLATTSRLEDDGDYKVLPPDWDERRPRLDEVAQAIVEDVRNATTNTPIRNPDQGITIPLPEVTVREADFLTRGEIAALPGIGRANGVSGPRSVAFPDVALSVRELGNPLPDLPIQVGIPITSLNIVDAGGNRYYATILDARPESPPDSMEDIRDEVVENVRRIEAYALVEQRAEEFRAMAVDAGLDSIVEMFAPPAPGEGAEPAVNPVLRWTQVQVGT